VHDDDDDDDVPACSSEALLRQSVEPATDDVTRLV